MPKNFSKLSEEVAACLWSYDISKLDLHNDRREIITQVLNYGNWNAVKWIRTAYSDDEIRKTLERPARGRWFKQCLNFWLLEFGLKLPEEIRQRALFNLNPAGYTRFLRI